jgi:hypothetical protein
LVIVASAISLAYLWSAYMQRSFEFDTETFFVCLVSLLALLVALLVIALVRSLFK